MAFAAFDGGISNTTAVLWGRDYANARKCNVHLRRVSSWLKLFPITPNEDRSKNSMSFS